MGDSRRFDLFAKLIKSTFPKARSIVDVAGGKGYLNLALLDLDYPKVTTYDVRVSGRIKGIEYKTKLFNSSAADDYDLIVGMHPDEATDHIIVEAGKRTIPFIVCPCCVKPSAVPFWGNYNRRNWLSHLLSLAERSGMETTMTTLPMNGRNEIIIGKPKHCWQNMTLVYKRSWD